MLMYRIPHRGGTTAVYSTHMAHLLRLQISYPYALTSIQQGAAPDRLQPTLVPRFGFQRRVSSVVLPVRAAFLHLS